MLQWYQRGSWVRFPVRTDFSRRFGCITPLHPAGRPRCPDMGGKKVLESSTVNKRGGIVAYGVQPSRIQRIYTDNSVYIVRCAVWRVSKIGRGLFSPVVKTPGCRIRRIYTDNSVYIIRCAVWRVSKIGRGLFSPVVKTPGCYTHWAAVYISKTERSVKYFDLEGTPPPCALEVLLGKLAVRVGREVRGSAFRVMISKGVHQKGGARCGLYSLTYIFRRLIGTKSFMDFSEGHRIGDEELANVAATLFELT
jgi:hypothetical protein